MPQYCVFLTFIARFRSSERMLFTGGTNSLFLAQVVQSLFSKNTLENETKTERAVKFEYNLSFK